jgi:hypothetical protein
MHLTFAITPYTKAALVPGGFFVFAYMLIDEPSFRLPYATAPRSYETC